MQCLPDGKSSESLRSLLQLFVACPGEKVDKLAGEINALKKHGIDKPMVFANLKDWLPRWANPDAGKPSNAQKHQVWR